MADLLVGDIPVFTTTPECGVLTGPGGVRWGEPQDLVAAALRRWRSADLESDRRVIRATLLGAYLNDEGWPSETARPDPPAVHVDDLDRCRRAQAATIVRLLSDAAIRGDDGTVTWVAPTYQPTGWTVRPAPADLYNGLTGIAVLLAGYRHEVRSGRADPVAGLGALLAAVVRTLELAEDRQAEMRADMAGERFLPRPESPGGYLGLGSRIWAWLLLQRLDATPADHGRQRAEAAAELVPEAVAADVEHDLVAGSAGAVVPLLRLAEHTGQLRWRGLAVTIGERLRDHAEPAAGGVCWPNGGFSSPTVGTAHGAYGIGWALARLARATGDSAMRHLADAAFRWADTHYLPQRRSWWNPGWQNDDSRRSWCHGAPGIGLCAADLLADNPADGEARERLARAASACWPDDGGPRFSLCHGRLGSWELLDQAQQAGVGPSGHVAVTARLVAAIARDGPASGVTRESFRPGLLAGAGGVAYQLLRMHPDCDLPSVLLPDPGLPGRGHEATRVDSAGCR